MRRVAVKRLINNENHVCYFNLAKLAVLYSPDALSLRDGEQKTVDLDEWKITTTYEDSDGDRITFSSHPAARQRWGEATAGRAWAIAILPAVDGATRCNAFSPQSAVGRVGGKTKR